jgi:hypothetical protein
VGTLSPSRTSRRFNSLQCWKSIVLMSGLQNWIPPDLYNRVPEMAASNCARAFGSFSVQNTWILRTRAAWFSPHASNNSQNDSSRVGHSFMTSAAERVAHTNLKTSTCSECFGLKLECVLLSSQTPPSQDLMEKYKKKTAKACNKLRSPKSRYPNSAAYRHRETDRR